MIKVKMSPRYRGLKGIVRSRWASYIFTGLRPIQQSEKYFKEGDNVAIITADDDDQVQSIWDVTIHQSSGSMRSVHNWGKWSLRYAKRLRANHSEEKRELNMPVSKRFKREAKREIRRLRRERVWDR